MSSHGRTPSLKGRILVSAGVSRDVLAEGLKTAARILSSAGIAAEWTVCRTRERAARCNGAVRPDEVFVQILPMPRQTDGSLGSAITGREGRMGRYARVYWDGVRDTADFVSARRSAVLGHVLAHEIGHLLLGRDSHSDSGLMRGDWGPRVLRRMSDQPLLFDGRQRRRISRLAPTSLELCCN